MNIPECPICKKGTKRSYHGSTRTCLGWTQMYDENGNPINNDPNTVTSYFQCEECKTQYASKEQYGKTFEIHYKNKDDEFQKIKYNDNET